MKVLIELCDQTNTLNIYADPEDMQKDDVLWLLDCAEEMIDVLSPEPKLRLAVDNTIDSGVPGLRKDPGCHDKGHDCRDCDYKEQCLKEDRHENTAISDNP